MNNGPRPKFTGSYKKKRVYVLLYMHNFGLYEWKINNCTPNTNIYVKEKFKKILKLFKNIQPQPKN